MLLNSESASALQNSGTLLCWSFPLGTESIYFLANSLFLLTSDGSNFNKTPKNALLSQPLSGQEDV